MSTKDFLLELGCEELPPKLLTQLSRALMQNLSEQLSAADLTYNKVTPFATPRRLAVLVQGLQTQQNDQNIERKGPAVSASEQAIQGFAKSCGVSISHLEKKSLAKADYYYFTKCKKGLKTADLLADIVSVAIKKIPISKPMRWGGTDFSFVRPLHWLVILLGSEVINATIMGLKSGNTTRGMRFAGERIFNIANANDYQKTLFDKAQIQVNFDTRRELIRTQIEQVAADNNATVVIDEILLDEVCALVEHPLAFAGKFDVKFLDMPKEVLISAMKLHQKYFHIVDDKGQLLPGFIAVANIRANDLSVIIDGNQRVIRPRLSDAQFFWTKDKAISSTTRLQKLDKVLFMDGLGQMADKARRIEALSGYIATELGENVTNCKRAGLLCKSDLVSDMVGEFADLQGVMGGYYAHNDGESVAVSKAISEHYHPRFSGDSLPSTPEGLVVAIADKVDNIVGIYGMGHKPTGSKDPYALKRAGLGLLRIMIEGKLLLNLSNLITQSVNLYNFGQDKSKEIYVFIVERLETYYSEKNIDKCILKAVLAAAKNNPDVKVDLVYDWHLRIMALNIFMQNEDFNYLIEANKRIKNILKGHKIESMALVEKTNLVKKTTQFDTDLYDATTKAYNVFNQNKYKNYQAIIEEFLQLKTVIDDFFDNVMVNDDDLEIRKLRLNNINRVRQLFLCVADITYLAK